MPQWLGGPEFIVIVLVVVILFGWKKLPDAARSLGRSMRIFKSEVNEMKRDQPSAASQDTVPGQAHPTAPPAAPADAHRPPAPPAPSQSAPTSSEFTDPTAPPRI